MVTGGMSGSWNLATTTEILDGLTARSWRTVSAKLPGVPGLVWMAGATFNNNVYILGILTMITRARDIISELKINICRWLCERHWTNL